MFKFFKKNYSEEDLKMFHFLRRSRLFQKLTDEELAYFTPFLYLRKYRESEVVFFSGDPSQALYFVKSGIVTLNIDIKNNFEKLLTLRSGRMFGDNAVLADTRRLYTAIVKTEECQLYVLPKANLMEIMADHTEIKAKIMTAFAEIHNDYTSILFRTYQSSLGFFDLSTVYAEMKL